MPDASTPDVIETLEAYLATARANKFCSIGIVMTGYPNVAALDYAGDVALQIGTYEGLRILGGKLRSAIDNWTLPTRDESLDASHHVYNMANGPLGFDFTVWLIDAEMTRVREGAPPPLKVAFWLGRDGKLTEDRRCWLDNVFRPALKLFGAVEDNGAMRGRHKAVYVPRDIVAASKAGESVPHFRALDRSLGVKGAITITLREAEHDPERNSDLDAWKQFARQLRLDGEEPVFIRDTCRAHDPLGDFATYPQASLDLPTRMAAYEAAKANLFIANGPQGLALFSSVPWLSFHNNAEREAYPPEYWVSAMSLKPGEQYPWSTKNQRLVWQADTYENILSAWHDLRTTL